MSADHFIAVIPGHSAWAAMRREPRPLAGDYPERYRAAYRTFGSRQALASGAHTGHCALSMGHADDIWNRACAEAGQPKKLTAPGDRALADMVLTHSLAMNGGLLHAIQSCTPDEVAAAVRGYRFFGLESAAAVLEDVARSWGDGSLDFADEEQLENEANERYYAAVPDDEVLMAAFVVRVRAEPTAFDTIH